MKLVQDTGIRTYQQSKYGKGSYKLDAYNSVYGATEKHHTYSIGQNELGQPWTLEFWVNMQRVASNISYKIMSLKPVTGVIPDVSIYVYNDQLAVTLNGNDFCTVAEAVGKRWTHIAVTHDPETGIAFFCDGVRIEELFVYNLYRNVGTYLLDFSAPTGCVCLFDAINFETTVKYADSTYTVPTKAPADLPSYIPSQDTPVDSLHEHTITFTSTFECETVDGQAFPFTITTTDSLLFNENLPELVLTGGDAEQPYEFYGYKLNGVRVGDNTPITDNLTLTANWLKPSLTFTVTPSEEGATVILTADNASQTGNSISVKPYQTVHYIVKKSNFATVRGAYTMDETDEELNVTLEPSTDRWYTNFDPSCYITIPNATIGTADAWEQVWHVRTGNKVNASHYVNSGDDAMYADFGISELYWKFFLSSNNSDWDITGTNGVGSLRAQRVTNYWVKMEFTGTQYIMSVATDDEHDMDQWTVTGTLDSTTKVYPITTYRVGVNSDASWSWFGYIDMGNSYIKVNHKVDGQDNWTYDYNGLTAEPGTDFILGSDVYLLGTELSDLISENFGGETSTSLAARGVYVNAYRTNDWLALQDYVLDATFSYGETGHYDCRAQSNGNGTFTLSTHSDKYWRTMDYYSVGQWYEDLGYSERRARGWNVYVSMNDVNPNNSGWQSSCTLLDSQSDQFSHNNNVYGDQGRELTYLIPEDKRNIPFRTIIFEITQGSSYTTCYKFKAYGQEVEDPRVPCTFTVDCDKDDATIILTGPNATQVGNSITVRTTETVTYRISKAGYKTVAGTHVMDGDFTLDVDLVPYVPPYSYGTTEYPLVDCYLRGAFGGDTCPALPEFQFRYDQEAGLYFLRKDDELYTEWKIASSDWSTIDWGVSGSGIIIPMDNNYGMTRAGSNCYESGARRFSTITINPNTGVVHIYPYGEAHEDEYTFTMIVDQEDANITLTSPGFTAEGNAITVKVGATIKYTVAKEGYTTIRGSYVMGEHDQTVSLTMEEGTDKRVYSGFSTGNYIDIATMPSSYNEVDFISYVRTGTTSPSRAAIVGGYSESNGKYFYLGTRSTTWSYRDYSQYHSGNTFTYESWYWVRLTGTNGNISLYTLPDANRAYSIDTLPPLSEWTVESTCTHTDSMADVPLHIGVGCYTSKLTYVPWTGAIDVVSTKIVVDGTSLYDGQTAKEGVDYTIVGTLTEETDA